MDSTDFIEHIAQETARHIARMRVVVDSIDDATLNRVPTSGDWTPGQVFDHMIKANTPYLATIEKALDTTPRPGPAPICHSYVAKLILKAAGPGSNYPAPKFLHPAPPPTKRERLDIWFAQMDVFERLIERAKGVDLSGTKIRNPFFKFLPMNLADAFEIMAEHTERHVAQIEARSASQ